MKWFQVDSDTPYDPKVRRLMDLARLPGGPHAAAQVMGHLFLLWCHVANHGQGDPGLGVAANGRPLDPEDMAYECQFRTVEDLREFLTMLAGAKLIDPTRWQQEQIVYLPAMKNRADEYARRKGRATTDPVRGNPGESGGMRGERPRITPETPLQDNTKQNKNTPPVPDGTGPPPEDLLENAGTDQVEALVAVWNLERTPGPAVRELTPQRRQALQRALKAKPDLADWRTVIRWVNSQRWCNAQGTGEHPNWRATLDWVAKPGNLVKLLERAAADGPQVAADGTQGRNARLGRTGFRRGEFAAALKGDGDAIH